MSNLFTLSFVLLSANPNVNTRISGISSIEVGSDETIEYLRTLVWESCKFDLPGLDAMDLSIRKVPRLSKPRLYYETTDHPRFPYPKSRNPAVVNSAQEVSLVGGASLNLPSNTILLNPQNTVAECFSGSEPHTNVIDFFVSQPVAPGKPFIACIVGSSCDFHSHVCRNSMVCRSNRQSTSYVVLYASSFHEPQLSLSLLTDFPNSHSRSFSSPTLYHLNTSIPSQKIPRVVPLLCLSCLFIQK